MGASKSDSFSIAHNAIADVFKALSHPAKIAIIEYLLNTNSCICGDIVNQLPLSQPTVSRHLKELKNAKLIKGNIDGTAICYCIDPQGFDTIKLFFEKITQSTSTSNDICC